MTPEKTKSTALAIVAFSLLAAGAVLLWVTLGAPGGVGLHDNPPTTMMMPEDNGRVTPPGHAEITAIPAPEATK